MVAKVIVYGGRGALGAKCVELLKKNNFWVASIDLAANDKADANILIKDLNSWTNQHEEVCAAVSKEIGDSKVYAILCVAGGWAGGNTKNTKFVGSADLMWKQSVWSTTIASSLAAKHLQDGGLLTLPGAFAATEGTSGMIGYGMAKAAIHQLCKSLAEKSSGMPDNSSAVCILPVTLDTPMNRKGMPNADFSSWTTLEYVAELLISWMDASKRPASGSLMKLETSGGKTNVISV